ncbi:MAG: PIG-L family deacetylase [Candidatus Riflebacteria bacterium]|nr:PIG-L family deacetylase [Candidatus Riflebacteria bacterium]
MKRALVTIGFIGMISLAGTPLFAEREVVSGSHYQDELSSISRTMDAGDRKSDRRQASTDTKDVQIVPVPRNTDSTGRLSPLQHKTDTLPSTMSNTIPPGGTTSLNKGRASKLYRDICGGKTVMWVGAHPDDEVTAVGTLALAGKYHKNPCYVLAATYWTNINKSVKNPRERRAANLWEKNEMLTDYMYLPEAWSVTASMTQSGPYFVFSQPDVIKQGIKDVLERIRPDIILTFTPHGFYGNPAHVQINKMVTELAGGELSYKPDVYWWVYMDDFLPSEVYGEYKMYQPTDQIDLTEKPEGSATSLWETKLKTVKAYSTTVDRAESALSSGILKTANRFENFHHVVFDSKLRKTFSDGGM